MLDFSNVPFDHRGMGPVNAYRHGFKTGFEDKVTRSICILEKGSEEFVAWQLGYSEGEAARVVFDRLQ